MKRTAHGKAAAAGATVVYETPPTDELRPVPAGAADPIARRRNGTFTSEGARAAVRRRADLAKLPDFAEGELEFVSAAEFAPFDAARRELTRQEGADIAATNGGLSRTTWTVVRGAAWLTSFAEYWATVAARTGSADAAERAARFFARASIERVKALDLAARDAAARPSRTMPWHALASAGGDDLEDAAPVHRGALSEPGTTDDTSEDENASAGRVDVTSEAEPA